MYSQPDPCWRTYILIALVAFFAGIHFQAEGLGWLGIATEKAFLIVP